MRLLKLHRWIRYLFAVLVVAAAHLAQQHIDLETSIEAPTLLSLGGVMVVGWTAGWGPGLLATVLSSMLMWVRLPSGTRVQDEIALIGMFALVGVLITTLSSLRRQAERESRKRAGQNSVVAELGRRALEGADPLRLAERAVTLVAGHLNVDHVEVLELQPDRRTLHPVAASGPSAEIEAHTIPVDDATLTGKALLTQQPLVVRDFERDSRLVRTERHQAGGARAAASVAIAGRSHGFGVLEAWSKNPRAFVRGDLDFLQSVAQLLGTLRERHEAGLETERARQRKTLLVDASNELSRSLDHVTRMEDLARLVVERMAAWCAIDLVGENGRIERAVLAIAKPEGIEMSRPAEHVLSREDGRHPVVRAFVSSRSVLAGRMTEESLGAPVPSEAWDTETDRTASRYTMCFPLSSRGRTLGVLSLGAREAAPYETADLELAEELADRVALSLDNAMLYCEVLDDHRRKDEFLATLSHELRNPLAPIVNALEIMRLSEDRATRQHALEVVSRQVHHLRHLVRDLLDVSRIARGVITLQREPVELGATLVNIIESHRPVADQHGHHLVLERPPQPVWLKLDPTRFEQIMTNLIQNSIEHGKPGTSIQIQAECHDDLATIRVIDDGPGIEPEILPRLFQPFSRGLDSTQIAPQGLGIGLYLVRQLVELHGGTIEAASEGPGRGTTFTICLPGASGPARVPDSAAPAHPAARSGRRARVLVVDDHVDSAAALAQLLAIWGHDATTALDGPSALDTARTFNPEIVLLDIALPGMDGYELARAIRRIPELEDVMLIAMTGFAQETDRRRAEEAGIDKHFAKPVDLAALRVLLGVTPAAPVRRATL